MIATPNHRRRALMLAALAFVMVNASAAVAQTAENVAVIINENSAASVRIGEVYAKRRALPVANVIRIKTSTAENIARPAYVSTIELPIAAALTRNLLHDRVLFLVLTKGVPLRVTGTAGQQGNVASVDSELTLLYRRMTGVVTTTPGRIDNPYYLGARPIAEAQPFTHKEHDIYLVTRLDAFTVEEAIALVDKGMAPSTQGRIVLDQQDKLMNRTGEDWLEEAATRLTAQGHGDRVLLERTVKGARDISPVLGYYSWGSNDPRNRIRTFGMGFVPGALAAMFVSSDARTFEQPPPEWVPTDDSDRTKWFAGTPQSLIGDLIREGATGAAGHVAEPFLQSTARPEILFPAYMAGFSLAEAFYLSMPHLSWQNIVIGDPLCAPFRRRTLTRAELGDALDRGTGLPAAFSMRRVNQLKRQITGASEEVVKLGARAEALLARNEHVAARTALEEATKLAPQAAYLQLQLALQYERDGDTDAAIERYRQVVATQPGNGLALNNLAFRLATTRNAAAEALPFARRAVTSAPQNPAFLDTLAWIEHLTGNNANASIRIGLAVRGAPQNAELRLHAAIIYAAAGSRAAAESELKEALKLQPALEGSSEVKQLWAQLEKPAAPSR